MVNFYLRIIAFLTAIILTFFGNSQVDAQCTILQNATPTITLRDNIEGFNGSVAMSVAWNPVRQLYYTCAGNWWTYGTQATLDNTGNLLLINDGGLDFRGNWWNPNLCQLEGNQCRACGQNIAFKVIDLNMNGHALNTGTFLFTPNQPDFQSQGKYDEVANEVIYRVPFQQTAPVQRINRANNVLASTVNLALPVAVGNLDAYTVFWTGVAGSEYAVYDNRLFRVYFFNKATGALTATTNIPAPPNTTFYGVSYANNQLWIYDRTNRRWQGFQVVNCGQNQNQPPVIQGPLTVCQGATGVQYTINPRGNNYNWTITPAGPVITGGQNTDQVTISFANAQPGTYTLTPTIVCGTNPTPIQIRVVAPPTITTQTPPIRCPNSPPTPLSASGGVSYVWTPAQTLDNANVANPNASPAVTTTYTVTGTDANGCTNTATVTVTVSNIPVNITFNPANPQRCTTDPPTQLNAQGAVTYVWTPGTGLSNPNIANPTANPLVTTTYTVTGTDASSCTGSATLTVTVLASPPSLLLSAGRYRFV